MVFESKGEKIGLIGAVLTILGSLLPWASITGKFTKLLPGGQIFYGIQGAGIFSLVLGGLGIVFLAFAAKHRKAGIIGDLIIGVLVMLLWWGQYSMVSQTFAKFQNVSGAQASFAYGFWILLIGGIIMLVGGILMIMEGKEALGTA